MALQEIEQALELFREGKPQLAIPLLEDLVELAKLGVEGAISGMAIYSGALDLKRAIETIDAMTTANS